MKITLIITLKELQLLILVFNANKLLVPINRKEKVSKCVIDKVRLKVKKLWNVWEDKIQFYESKKTLKINLDTVEAHYFEEFIDLVLPQLEADDFYSINALNKIKRFINQSI